MSAENSQRLTIAEATVLCEAAARRAGASEAAARSLAASAVAAEAAGQASVGLEHFVDHLDALEAGRIDGQAEPAISRPVPAIFLSDAGGGIAQLGFDRVFHDLVHAAGTFGIAAFAQRNAFTCGALGWFVGRLAEAGLVAIAATNGPALLAGSGATRPVFCTNPLAFAAPVDGGPPLLIDQASSATAFVNVRRATARGEPIPPGWALDAAGRPTTDPAEAMAGALLAFGGSRGANVALMVEVLAAGLTGANWSLDAPSFTDGSRSPGAGLFIVALAPALLEPGFAARLAAQLDRLSGEHGVHIPGLAKAAAFRRAEAEGLAVPMPLLERLGYGQARAPI